MSNTYDNHSIILSRKFKSQQKENFISCALLTDHLLVFQWQVRADVQTISPFDKNHVSITVVNRTSVWDKEIMTQVWCSDNRGSDNRGMDNRGCTVLCEKKLKPSRES